MEDRNIRGRVEEFIGALHRVEREGEAAVDDLVALFAPDARIVNSMTRRAQDEPRGREAIRGFWSDYAAMLRGSESRFAHVTVGDGVAGLFWTTHGSSSQYDGATLLEFDATGHIALLRGYFDPEEFRERRQAA